MAGYYTREELLQLWVDSTDKSYNRPFVDKGDGAGLEVFNQAWSQLERVSLAIRNTFQSLYILPWSGQTAEPATGERYATVQLTVTRDAALDSSFVLMPAGVVVLEHTTDHSDDGSVDVLTGRAYAIDAPVAWLSTGDATQQAQAICTVSGWGGNNPQPDTLTVWQQNGKQLAGTRANVIAGFPRCTVVAQEGGDGFTPAHVGQYLRFTTGMNAGVQRRVVAQYTPTNTDAGKADLASDMVFQVSGVAGTFVVGEDVAHPNGATGTVVFYDALSGTLVVERRTGVFSIPSPVIGGTSGAIGVLDSVETSGLLVALTVGPVVGAFQLYETVLQAGSGAAGMFALHANSTVYLKPLSGPDFDAVNGVTGLTSGATATPTVVSRDPMLMPEPGQTAGWSFLAWDSHLGITVTNAESPTGGRAAMLDELGLERGMPRVQGESDDAYRQRISKLADVVSPNAILRAIIRGLQPLGVTGCFREVGQAKLRGFFYDVDPALAPDYGFAYDMDPSLRPGDRWKVYLDFASYRGVFLVGIPPTGHGEFGFAYDNHPLGAYDSSPTLTFYDGYAVQTANALKALWLDINNRKAGGVGFEFYQEADGCV